MSRTTASKHDRLFRAMVLMGGSMALGCGGKSTDNDGGAAAGSGGSGGTGPTDPDAGMIDIGSGGTAGRSPVEPGPFPCVPAQMECSPQSPMCAYAYDGWQLPEGCSCNPDRPRSAADCEAGEAFVCRRGTERADGKPYTEVVPFECTCVPEQDYCGYECELAFSDGFGASYACGTEEADARGAGGAGGAAAHDTLCGCAVVVLK